MQFAEQTHSNSGKYCYKQCSWKENTFTGMLTTFVSSAEKWGKCPHGWDCCLKQIIPAKKTLLGEASCLDWTSSVPRVERCLVRGRIWPPQAWSEHQLSTFICKKRFALWLLIRAVLQQQRVLSTCRESAPCRRLTLGIPTLSIPNHWPIKIASYVSAFSSPGPLPPPSAPQREKKLEMR